MGNYKETVVTMKENKNAGGIQMEYIKPEMEVLMLREMDVITASGEWDSDTDLDELLKAGF